MLDIQNFFNQILQMKWSDYLDIILVAFLLYKLLPLFRSSGTMRVAKIVGMLLVATWLTDLLQLHTMNFLLNQVLAVGLIAVVVLFQPELRRVLDHLGSVKLAGFLGVEKKKSQEMESIITQTVMACEAMSKERTGALIVLARENRLE